MTDKRRLPARIVNIAAAIEPSGEISRHLQNTYEALTGTPEWEVVILACRCAKRELPARPVAGVAELLLDRDFLAADLLIYHFGGWDPLFDALVVGNGRARQAVFVHPLRPVECVSANERQRAARSFAQLDTLRQADRLWPTSPESAALFAARNFDPAQIEPLLLAGSADRSGALIRERVAALLSVGSVAPQNGAGLNPPGPDAADPL
jgi:hypothetical protein